LIKIIRIQYDLRVLSISAIKRAIYDAEISKYTSIDLPDPNTANITITAADEISGTNELRERLNQLVYDNQIRIDTEKEFSLIRNLIFAQAFFPCENIDEILKDSII
jgi:His-Xaa-Ser system protein HxsD